MPQTKAEALNQAGLGVAYAMGAELIGPLVGRVVGGLRSAVKAAKALRKPKVNTYTSNSIASKYAKFDNATIRTATEEDLARFETDILPKLEEELMELYSSPEAIRQAEINSGIARRSKSRSIRNKEGINREEGILGSGPTANDAELYTKRLQERVTLDGPIEQ
jgi:hypothetical protein